MAEFNSIEDITRVVKGIRAVEGLVRSEDQIPGPTPTPGTHPITVLVTGDKITSETPPYVGGYSEKDMYNGMITFRNEESQSPGDDWNELEEGQCLVYEVNKVDLEASKRYKGSIVGYRNTKPLIEVQVTDVVLPEFACGFEYDEDTNTYTFDYARLVGNNIITGLVDYPAAIPGTTCPYIGVDPVVDSTTTIDRVQATSIFVPTDGVDAIPAIRQSQVKKQFHFDRNAFGLVIDVREAATTVETFSTVNFLNDDNDLIYWEADDVADTLQAKFDMEVIITKTVFADKITGFGMVAGKLRLTYTRTQIDSGFNFSGVYIEDNRTVTPNQFYEVDACLFGACCDAEDLGIVAVITPYTGELPLTVTLETTITGGVPPYTVYVEWADFTENDTFTYGAAGVHTETNVHTFEQDGEYEVLITVTDACGQNASDIKTVTVSPLPPPPPPPTEYITPGDGSHNVVEDGDYFCEGWGGGGDGATAYDGVDHGGGGGGGGGGYSASTIFVAAGFPILFHVGAANTDTNIQSGTIIAKAGGTTGFGGGGGLGAQNVSLGTGTIKYDGGDGANGNATDGGGGGSSAGTAANGTDATTITGATAPTGGGNGGNGNTGGGAGSAGTQPGGGGGGAGPTGSTAGVGAAGKVRITGPV